jgi:hypothetical protein
MAQDDDLRRDLLARIEARRAGVREYLRENRPGFRRRATATLVLTSLAAIFTAGPAVGGVKFSEGVANALGLKSDSTVWRVLCLAALVVSVGAAVMTNLNKLNEAALNRLTTAEAAKAELEGLVTLLEFGHLPLEDAAKLFHDYTVKIPFIDDGPLPVAGSSAPSSQSQP